MQKLEAFLAKCRRAARYLVNVSQELATTQGMPMSARECQQHLEQHDRFVQKVLEDPLLVDLQSWEEELAQLQTGDLSIVSIPENRSVPLQGDHLCYKIRACSVVAIPESGSVVSLLRDHLIYQTYNYGITSIPESKVVDIISYRPTVVHLAVASKRPLHLLQQLLQHSGRGIMAMGVYVKVAIPKKTTLSIRPITPILWPNQKIDHGYENAQKCPPERLISTNDSSSLAISGNSNRMGLLTVIHLLKHHLIYQASISVLESR